MINASFDSEIRNPVESTTYIVFIVHLINFIFIPIIIPKFIFIPIMPGVMQNIHNHFHFLKVQNFTLVVFIRFIRIISLIKTN